jgi:hypothetical protein
VRRRRRRHLDLHGGATAEGGVVCSAYGAVSVHCRSGAAGGPAKAARVRRARVGAPKVGVRGERARGRRARHARGAVPLRREQRAKAERSAHQLREGGRGGGGSGWRGCGEGAD